VCSSDLKQFVEATIQRKQSIADEELRDAYPNRYKQMMTDRDRQTRYVIRQNLSKPRIDSEYDSQECERSYESENNLPHRKSNRLYSSVNERNDDHDRRYREMPIMRVQNRSHWSRNNELIRPVMRFRDHGDDSSSSDDNYSDNRNHRSRRLDDHRNRKDSTHTNDSDSESFYESHARRNDKSRNNKARYMKPDKFDGKGSWESFLLQFKNCAKYNRWNTGDCEAHLRWAMTGLAAQILWVLKVCHTNICCRNSVIDLVVKV